MFWCLQYFLYTYKRILILKPLGNTSLMHFYAVQSLLSSVFSYNDSIISKITPWNWVWKLGPSMGNSFKHQSSAQVPCQLEKQTRTLLFDAQIYIWRAWEQLTWNLPFKINTMLILKSISILSIHMESFFYHAGASNHLSVC